MIKNITFVLKKNKKLPEKQASSDSHRHDEHQHEQQIDDCG
jgi:hypothetical protein